MRYTKKEGDIVIVKPPVPVTDRNVDRMLDELVRYLREGKPYALLFDLREAQVPSAVQRRKLSEHVQVHHSVIRRHVKGLALVSPSAALRGMVTAVFWVSPLPIEYQLFDGYDDAVRWAQHMLTAGETAPR